MVESSDIARGYNDKIETGINKKTLCKIDHFTLFLNLKKKSQNTKETIAISDLLATWNVQEKNGYVELVVGVLSVDLCIWDAWVT